MLVGKLFPKNTINRPFPRMKQQNKQDLSESVCGLQEQDCARDFRLLELAGLSNELLHEACCLRGMF